MAKKPTYEELKQKIKQLEKEAVKRRHAEETLRDSEEKYHNLYELMRLIADNVPDLIWAKDMDNRYLFANKAISNKLLMCGSPEEAIGKTDMFFAEQERKAGYKHSFGEICVNSDVIIKERKAPGRFMEDGLVRNEYLVLDVHKAPFFNKDGEMIGTVGCGRDVTKEKEIEAALRESEEKYKTLTENSLTGVFIHQNGRYVFVNDRFAEIHGYKPKELLGKEFIELLHPDEREGVALRVSKRLRGETHPRRYEIRRLKKDGNIVWGEMMATNIQYRGKPAIMGNLIDIADRKRAEEKILHQSKVLDGINRLFREALICESDEEVAQTCLSVAEELTNSKFGFIGELNPTGLFDTIAISNPGWDECKMPNFEATKLIKNMKIRGIDRSLLKDEESRIVNDPSSHLDRVGTPEGHPTINCFLGVPLKQADKTIGMIGLGNKESGYDLADQQAIEDLSLAFVEALERKRAEKAIRISNEELLKEHNQRKILSKRLIDLLEKDRRQIAMDLHDHIGQTLTSLKIDLEIIHDQLEDSKPELQPQIKAVQEKAVQVMKDVKSVSHGLRPTMIDALGVKSSLRNLFSEIKQQTGMEIRFFNRGIPKRFEEEKELAIYRIAQESLTNVIRHARAKNVFVNLVKKDDKLSLSVEDDGVGFDQNKVMKTSKRKGPLGLFIMRERAIQLDGEFTIESQPGKGAHVLVEIPL